MKLLQDVAIANDGGIRTNLDFAREKRSLDNAHIGLHPGFRVICAPPNAKMSIGCNKAKKHGRIFCMKSSGFHFFEGTTQAAKSCQNYCEARCA
jgi:hypothetical protein